MFTSKFVVTMHGKIVQGKVSKMGSRIATVLSRMCLVLNQHRWPRLPQESIVSVAGKEINFLALFVPQVERGSLAMILCGVGRSGAFGAGGRRQPEDNKMIGDNAREGLGRGLGAALLGC
jgi:hypothetical protein